MEKPVQTEGEDYWAFSRREREWEKATGRRCQMCGVFDVSDKGYPCTCYECTHLVTDKGEVRHSDYIRCPKCRSQSQPGDCEMYELFEEGEHRVTCQFCENEFEVSTSISYTFRSPELIEEEPEEEDD